MDFRFGCEENATQFFISFCFSLNIFFLLVFAWPSFGRICGTFPSLPGFKWNCCPRSSDILLPKRWGLQAYQKTQWFILKSRDNWKSRNEAKWGWNAKTKVDMREGERERRNFSLWQSLKPFNSCDLASFFYAVYVLIFFMFKLPNIKVLFLKRMRREIIVVW